MSGTPPVRQMIREAVEALGSPTTNVAVKQWIEAKYPGTNPSTVQCHLIMCCVNQPSRVHYPESCNPRTCNDPRYDFLFRPQRGVLEWYDPARHGVWSIEQDNAGEFAICCDGGELQYPAKRDVGTPKTTHQRRPGFIPVTQSQIDAAARLHSRLPQWASTDRAFERLSRHFAWDLEGCILKAAAINDLYSTNVYAIWRMAEHLHNVMKAPPEAPEELVAAIASLPDEDGTVRRRHWSFASKICHFFVNGDRFPIYDSFCRDMIAHHLGHVASLPDDGNTYRVFINSVERLRGESGLSVSLRDMDRYMWLAGQYRQWQKHGDEFPTNGELRTLFSSPDPEIKQELSALLGEAPSP